MFAQIAKNQANQAKVSRTKTKPARPCVFCTKPQSRLKRHTKSTCNSYESHPSFNNEQEGAIPILLQI